MSQHGELKTSERKKKRDDIPASNLFCSSVTSRTRATLILSTHLYVDPLAATQWAPGGMWVVVEYVGGWVV